MGCTVDQSGNQQGMGAEAVLSDAPGGWELRHLGGEAGSWGSRPGSGGTPDARKLPPKPCASHNPTILVLGWFLFLTIQLPQESLILAL